MSDLRQAAQQALEALTPFVRGSWTPGLAVQAAAAMDRLKAALAEPSVEPVKQCMAHGECFGGECIYQRPAEPGQEPVAWRWGYRSVTTGEMDWRGYVEIAAHPNLRSPEIIMEPLYTAPPQRKPLTEEEIQAAWDSVDMRHPRGNETRIAFARAIERAQGGEQK